MALLRSRTFDMSWLSSSRVTLCGAALRVLIRGSTSLPRYYKFIEQHHRRNFAEQMTSQLRASLVERAAAFLQEAEASHYTWNASTWMKPRHLLGVLCAEDRRAWCAAELLRALGSEQQLLEKLGGRARPTPSDTVDRLLLNRLQARVADGTLAAEMQVWGLQRPTAKQELLTLAVEPAGDTAASPVLSQSRTPLIYGEMRTWLFVGFAHNLPLKSLVSRLAMLEKRHPKCHALTLDHVLKYHMSQEGARAERKSAAMRSSSDGAMRAAAKDRAEDKKVHTTCVCMPVGVRVICICGSTPCCMPCRRRSQVAPTAASSNSLR